MILPLLSEALGTPHAAMGLAIAFLSLALKRYGSPRRQGLCSHPARLWASFDFVPCYEALGAPRRQGLCCQPAHLWATSDFAFRSEVLGTHHAAGAM